MLMQLMVVFRKHPPQQESRVSEVRSCEVAVTALCWAGRLCLSAQEPGKGGGGVRRVLQAPAHR